METREAIEALLMLGDMPTVENNPLPADDNALLVPIIGTTPDEIQDASLATNVTEPPQLTKELSHWYTHQETPPPGMVIGTAIKTDGEFDNDTQEVKIEKKDLNIKQYGIK